MLMTSQQRIGHFHREGYPESIAEFGEGKILRFYCSSAFSKRIAQITRDFLLIIGIDDRFF